MRIRGGDDVMEICKEMIKLRKGLDERGIVWIDASETEINSIAVAAPYCLILIAQYTEHNS